MTTLAHTPGEAAALDEPGGLAMLGDRVLIADTNYNRIAVLDPDSGTIERWRLQWPQDAHGVDPGSVDTDPSAQ